MQQNKKNGLGEEERMMCGGSSKGDQSGVMWVEGDDAGVWMEGWVDSYLCLGRSRRAAIELEVPVFQFIIEGAEKSFYHAYIVGVWIFIRTPSLDNSIYFQVDNLRDT